MIARPEMTADVDTALARGVLYRALTLGFTRPTDETLAALGADGARAALLAAATELDAGRRAAEPLLPAAQAFTGLPPGPLAERRRAYARLFGHAHAPVPPFETEYGLTGTHRQPQQLADIAGYYLAFGLRPVARLDERVDHVACQCEFMDFLARKEAFLLASMAPGSAGDDGAEQREVVRNAARAFLRDHLGRFGRAFASRVERADRGGFYAGLGDLLRRLLGLECERYGVTPGPATLELQPPVADEAPMACGSAGDANVPLVEGQRPR